MKYAAILLVSICLTGFGYLLNEMFKGDGDSLSGLIVNKPPVKERKFVLASIESGHHIIYKKKTGPWSYFSYAEAWTSKSNFGVEVPAGWDWGFVGAGKPFEETGGVVEVLAPAISSLGTVPNRDSRKSEILNNSTGLTWSKSEFYKNLPDVRGDMEKCAEIHALSRPDLVEMARVSLEEILSEIVNQSNTELPAITVRVKFEQYSPPENSTRAWDESLSSCNGFVIEE